MSREEDGGRLACRAASERIGSSAGKASKVRTDSAPQSDEQSVSFANTVSKAGLNDFVQLDTLLNDPSSVCGFQGANLENKKGPMAQLVRAPPCHGGGRGFESHSGRLSFHKTIGGIPEWPKGADCKSVSSAFGGSNPPSPTARALNMGS